jgi:hypothetical protein
MTKERLKRVLGLSVGQKAKIVVQRGEGGEEWKRIVTTRVVRYPKH